MTGALEPVELPLCDALVRWTEPRLVTAVRAEERQHAPYHLHDYYRISDHQLQLCTDDELFVPSEDTRWGGEPRADGLIFAWRALERDLRLRIERGEFHLRGVQVVPTRERLPTVIESAWAADFKFDFHAGRIRCGDFAYVAIVAVRGPPPVETTTDSVNMPSDSAAYVTPPITQRTVRELSDEEVFFLLEEHARRVTESKSYPVLDPGITKVTFMPLILRKMRARAASGELLDTLAAEARALAQWIHEKAPSYQTPTAGAIRNALRDEYRRLKA